MKTNNLPNLLSLTKFSYISGYTEEAVYQKRNKAGWKSEKITEETFNGIKINILEYNRWCCLNEKSLDLKSLSAEKIQFIKKAVFLNNKQIKESFLRKMARFTNTDLNRLLIKAPDNHVMVNVILFDVIINKLNERLG